METTFAIEFFRLYDRKIASGEITFAQTGMEKDDFTKLCTNKDYVLPKKEIERLSENMKLSKEETALLLSFVKEEKEEF